MTIGPAPMMRIDLMSVRLGMPRKRLAEAEAGDAAGSVIDVSDLRLSGAYRQRRTEGEP